MRRKKAVILLSGGLDSAVALAAAIKKGCEPHCLTFDYGQRHRKEIVSAKKIARKVNVSLEVVSLKFPWQGSSLVDKNAALPHDRSIKDIKGGIPTTYVPARNSIFLSIAAAYAEVIGAKAIYIGAHFLDASGYPDCRRRYLEAFNKAIAMGTKAGARHRLRLEFPLIRRTKADIIRLGASLGVPFQLTWSCYTGGKRPCMRCDSCILRAKGFKEAGINDPLLNTNEHELHTN